MSVDVILKMTIELSQRKFVETNLFKKINATSNVISPHCNNPDGHSDGRATER